MDKKWYKRKGKRRHRPINSSTACKAFETIPFLKDDIDSGA